MLILLKIIIGLALDGSRATGFWVLYLGCTGDVGSFLMFLVYFCLENRAIVLLEKCKLYNREGLLKYITII